MSRLEITIVALVVILVVVALVDFSLNPAASNVESAIRTVRDVAVTQYERLSGREGDEEDTEAAPAPPPPARPTQPRAAAAVPAEPEPAVEPEAPAPEPAPVAVAIPPAEPEPEPPPPVRQAYYLPGRTAAWTAFELPFTSPILIRSAGRIETATEGSGPDGLTSSILEADLRRRSAESQRVTPNAPYLALIGRVCTPRSCTEPFLVGSERVLCPSWLNATGTLQLWTNNHLRVEGEQTSLSFTRTAGGYSFYVEPVAESQCTTPSEQPTGLAMSSESRALASGEALRNPEFVVSSSQSSWKPFFIPLDTPVRIRAAGSMQPIGGADSTGPDGIVVPDVPSWHYPGQRSIVVDADNQLYEGSLPYQALIGRLCGAAGCDAPFLVGSDRVICATPEYRERLELWVNHIRRPAGLLAQQTPMSFSAFELQQRRGAYRFEVTQAPASSCQP